MVLVVTHSRDDHAPAIFDELAARGERAVRFDTDALAANAFGADVAHGRSNTALRLTGGGTHARLRTADGWVSCEEVDAILYRHLHLPDAAHVIDLQARELASSELRATLEGTLLPIEAYWLNHPYANRLARHKPLQLALAAREGLAVPDTVVTDDPSEVREHYRRWDGRMVAKLAGGQVVAGDAQEQYAVFTAMLDEGDLRDDATLAACPAIYQRYVEKSYDLRVTIVGERLFCCRIDSQGHPDGLIDWRAAGADAVPIAVATLDPGVAERCVALVRRFGLDFAALDFVVTPAGDAVFLELNAAGRWLWVQEATGMPIAAAIVDRLLSGAREAACSTVPLMSGA